jgi:hypothetical protein
VKWSNWHENYNTWEPEQCLENCREVLEEFMQSRKKLEPVPLPSVVPIPETPQTPPTTPTKGSKPRAPARKSARINYLSSRTRYYSDDSDTDSLFEEPAKTPPRLSTEQLIRDALEAKGLVGKDVGGSGDCLYRCLSDQLFGTPEVYI